MPTPNTTKEVDEIIRQMERETWINDMVVEAEGDGTFLCFTSKYKNRLRNLLTSLTAKHEALDPVRVGMLRQWINEDRIINNPNKKLITNEDIVFWLTPTKTDKQ